MLLDVELNYFPVFARSNGKGHPDTLDTAHPSVGATEVDSRYLPLALNHESSFQCVVGFDLEHPFCPEDLLLRRN